MIADESLQYEDANGLVVDDGLWPASPPEVVEPVTENQNMLSAPEPFVIKEQGGLVTVAHDFCNRTV